MQQEKPFTIFEDAKTDPIQPMGERELQLMQGRNFVYKKIKSIWLGYERSKKVFLYVEPIFRFVAYIYLAYKFFS